MINLAARFSCFRTLSKIIFLYGLSNRLFSILPYSDFILSHLLSILSCISLLLIFSYSSFLLLSIILNHPFKSSIYSSVYSFSTSGIFVSNDALIFLIASFISLLLSFVILLFSSFFAVLIITLISED